MRRRLLPVLLIVGALALGACSKADPPAPPPAGGAAVLPGPVPGDLSLRPAPTGLPGAPPFTGTLTDGSSLSVADLWTQRPVVLVFFSSWCTTCAQRQSALSDLARTYRDKVVFVGVNAEEDETGALETYLRDHKVEYPVVVDKDQNIWRSYAVREPPAIAIIAKGGVLVRGWPGGIDAATLDSRLHELVLAK